MVDERKYKESEWSRFMRELSKKEDKGGESRGKAVSLLDKVSNKQ